MHLFGNVAPIAEIEALGVPVIEDAAQAAGSHARRQGGPGALGTLATFSFFPSKNLGGFGDGGAITTRDDDARRPRPHAALPRLRRTRSPTSTSATTRASTSSRPRSCACCCRTSTAGPTAAAPRAATTRRPVSASSSTLPEPVGGAAPAWHLYVVRSERADALAVALKAAGIGHKAYYRTPVHEQPAMRAYAGGADLPGTAEVARTHLAIPMSPVLGADQAAEVAQTVRALELAAR